LRPFPGLLWEWGWFCIQLGTGLVQARVAWAVPPASRQRVSDMNTRLFPDDAEARRTIVEIGRRMYKKNFVAANDGNVSCKVSDEAIWATPTGVSKGFMTEDMLIKMRLDGAVLASGALEPSSEIKAHLRIYNENPDLGGAVHAHPPVSTSFAVAGMALDLAIYPEAIVSLGIIPCVHYETPGSDGVADSIAPYCKDYNGLLLANHGALAWGKTLMEAFFRLEAMEHYATILMYSSNIIGKTNTLSNDQISQLMVIRSNLGITAGRRPQGAAMPTNMEDVGGQK